MSLALVIAVKLQPLVLVAIAMLAFGPATGCSFFPETLQTELIHNPFPQLNRVAILPFFNQSSEPTVDTDLVAEKYYAALQAVPGFEVLPIGVAKAQWMQYAMTHGEPRTGAQFQQLANLMGVEAIVVGSVTDFDSYYPPRMAMTVHWYAANEGFHPIPAGYGLPWGTEQEEQIPKRIAREAEFELARSQLATQTPYASETVVPVASASIAQTNGEFDISQGVQINNGLRPAKGQVELTPPSSIGTVTTPPPPTVMDDPFNNPFADEPMHAGIPMDAGQVLEYGEVVEMEAPLPSEWPNPTDLIPDPPSPLRPVASVNHEPVLSHTRLYRGDDSYFTNRLADYVETGDDARPGGWQGYLKRSDDFVQFCCHLHIVEMLESRGGSEQSDLILRWPLSRY
jgi:hypothetical protein